MTEHPIASDKPESSGDDRPSLAVPGFLTALSILPLGLEASLVREMLAQVGDGTMSFPNLVETWLACACLVAAIVLMFLRRRGSRALFVLAAILAVVTVGAPFGRIALGVAIVAAIGAFVATLQARRPPAA